MQWTTLAAFIGLELVLCFIPGPAVMAVVGAALARGGAGMATAFGILTGNLLYLIISALGIASLLLASHSAFMIMKWCGAAYLAYLGIHALVSKPNGMQREIVTPPGRLLRGWLSGILTQLANPKALVFFVAILPQFINPHAALIPQIIFLGVASLAVELAVLSTYVAAANHIRDRGISARSRVWAERAGGICLLGVAAAVVREAV